MKGAEVMTVIYGGLMLVFSIIFLIGFFRYRKRVRPYTKYALIPAVILIVVDTAVLVLNPEGLENVAIPSVMCIDLVVFVKLILFGAVGMYCAASIGGKHAPLTRSLLARRALPATGLTRGLLLWAPAIAAGGVAYSCVLFTLVEVRLSDAVRELVESSGTNLPLAMNASLLGAVAMFEFALSEEIVFRLGIQNYLARVLKLRGNNYWIAIVLTTVFWSIAHANTILTGPR